MVLGNIDKLDSVFDTDLQSLLILGEQFSGKKETLHRLALDDIYNGLDVVFIGDANYILSKVPKDRAEDVIYFSPTESSFSFNIFSGVPKHLHPLFVSTVLTALKGIWGFDSKDSSTANMDLYLKGLLNTAVSVPGSDLIGLKYLLSNPQFRTDSVSQIKDPFIKDFWNEFESLSAKDQRQETNSTRNKLWAFMFDPVIRNCLGQKYNKLSFKNKIVLINLDEGLLGSENARLLGALILAQLYVQSQDGLRTNVYIEDSWRFGSQILGMLLSSNLQMVIVAQFLDQFSKAVVPTILGSAMYILSFCPSPRDAYELESLFYTQPGDNLLYQGYRQARLSGGSGYLLNTFPDVYPLTQQENKIKKRCVSQYTQPKMKIERRLRRYF